MNERTIGQLIGNRFRLSQHIGDGGMGQIFLAIDTQLFDRRVAIKLLSQHLPGNAEMQAELRRRFEIEARISVLLGDHPRIIRVTDYGVDQGQPYLAMEYLGQPPQGRDLGDLLKKEGPLDPVRAVRLGRQICSGLYHAHGFEFQLEGQTIHGVLHRDIKPSNLFVISESTLGETIKILDFGIAKVMSDVTLAMGTQTGFVGTLGYASPEQLRGRLLDARSDIYSLGVVLYQMLTGELPIMPKPLSFEAWYDAHNTMLPRPFRRDHLRYVIPDALEAVVLECLAKDPLKRPQTMQILSEALDAALHPSASSVTVVGQPKPSQPPLDDTLTILPVPSIPQSNTLPSQPRLELSPAQHSQLEALLSKTFGPIAPLLLKQGLKESFTSEELITHLCADLAPRQQTQLRSEIARLLGSVATTTAPPPPTTASRFKTTPALSATFLNQCEQELMQIIGPVAGLVVQQALLQSPTLSASQLIDVLADQIPYPLQAQAFRHKLK